MAYRVVWSPKAVEDVEAIAAYIARDSPSYAAAVVQKVIEITDELTQDATKGRLIPEIEESKVMEQFAYSYRLLYRIEGETVTVAALIHGKRLLYLTD
ncbi:type II toxin-antitoxin system RelE/ParE family toxin [Cyanobacterium aponinum UTEX 3222]|uniref:Plasmid stabilization system n=3 Tax=Cyanobacterium aponinum TaxID=379064 RepID=K9Z5M5_CYAAP|nr:type II toxin-antitoxin system RelE/ParE family toxin [Cyanobacterium aponinum]WRL41210.1 type II toxin-antitoxin system RelE/ParE family toxin [Cyanobacterium aponinum UTEX 3222]AFZ53870.1 plasmid stabilization system [Cyanobacterium aponinum PCC 10605]MBD2395106.1 type II toxin-antitoxin system RelE/ParE family toxin [Cyanobacterium aponinum FACHB-4101]MTF39815.1 type II toxin-antitoxin system RelE/ParE family toxin [Cyanobacterium aponinum 0216]PHV63014.1 type II toxin-antitoxin system R